MIYKKKVYSYVHFAQNVQEVSVGQHSINCVRKEQVRPEEFVN